MSHPAYDKRFGYHAYICMCIYWTIYMYVYILAPIIELVSHPAYDKRFGYHAYICMCIYVCVYISTNAMT